MCTTVKHTFERFQERHEQTFDWYEVDYRSPMSDSRVAPVEDNLDAFLATVVRSGAFHTGSDPDVSTYWSDVAFPLLNGIGAARFAPGRVEERAREVVAPYVDRGLPFIW